VGFESQPVEGESLRLLSAKAIDATDGGKILHELTRQTFGPTLLRTTDAAPPV